jgi:hypothetical protein
MTFLYRHYANGSWPWTRTVGIRITHVQNSVKKKGRYGPFF